MEQVLCFPHATLASFTPKSFNLALLPLLPVDETPAQRLACLRRECVRVRLNAEIILRFATALEVSTDDPWQPATGSKPQRKPGRRVLQRLKRIEALPSHLQTTVLKSLDLMLKSVAPVKRALDQTRESTR